MAARCQSADQMSDEGRCGPTLLELLASMAGLVILARRGIVAGRPAAAATPKRLQHVWSSIDAGQKSCRAGLRLPLCGHWRK
nr:hypothetical protein CFP56_03107 [Quercus suber]